MVREGADGKGDDGETSLARDELRKRGRQRTAAHWHRTVPASQRFYAFGSLPSVRVRGIHGSSCFGVTSAAGAASTLGLATADGSAAAADADGGGALRGLGKGRGGLVPRVVEGGEKVLRLPLAGQSRAEQSNKKAKETDGVRVNSRKRGGRRGTARSRPIPSHPVTAPWHQ